MPHCSSHPPHRRRLVSRLSAQDFDRADRFFSRAIDKWESLYRGGRKGGRDELATLYKVRGNVRVDSKRFAEGLEDYNRAIDLMKTDGENDRGIARYQVGIHMANTHTENGMACVCRSTQTPLCRGV